MRYILDFDGVIFNTEALKKKMKECDIPENERNGKTFKRIKDFDPTFDLQSLLFPDARAFLEEHRGECCIVTTASSRNVDNNTNDEAQVAFQKLKLELAGVAKFVPKENIYVVADSKHEALAAIKAELEAADEEGMFVDDREKYVREAKALGIPSVWMDREHKSVGRNPEGVPTMLDFPRVGSFKEFVAYLKTRTPEKN